MADLFNQQISATYSGLLKTTSSGVLSASLAQITDGRGNVSQLYLSTTSVQFYGLYTFPNSNGSDGQVLKTDGAGVLTWEDDIASNQLDTAGNTGTGSINLNTQSLTLTGTVNEITTNANAQSISIGFPTAGVTLPNNSIATTQLASDTSTKIATTEYVTDAIGLIPTGDVTKTGTITANQIAVWNDSTNELRSDETVTIGTDHSITLSQPNSAGADIENYNIGGGNVPNNDSSPPSTTLRKNTGFGKDNLNALTEGLYNVAVGHSSLKANTVASSNVAIGYESLLRNVDGGENVAIGLQSMHFNVSGDGNVAIGREALRKNTADKNTAVGWQTGSLNTTGQYNSYLGYLAGTYNTTGDQNVAIGSEAAYFFIGGNNTSIGAKSLLGVNGTSTGTGNTAIGYNSGNAITTGSKNVIIGSNTGSTIATSDNNIIISDGDGNNRIQVDSGGNVGIGTGSTIYADLEIKRASEVTVALHNSSSITSGNRGNISFYNSSVSTVALIIAVADTDDVGTALEFYTRPVGGSLTNSLNISSGGAATFSGSGTFIKTSSGNSTTPLVVRNSGSTVIGTESKIFLSTVAGDDRGAYISSIITDASNGNALILATNTAGASPTERMRITSGGNVEQGTVGTTASAYYYFNATTTADTGIIFKDNSTTNSGFLTYNHSSDSMKFGTNTSLALTISSGGDVGIGTDSPSSYDGESNDLVVASGVDGATPTPGITIACLGN